MAKRKFLKWLGIVGFIIILLVSSTIIAVIVFSGTQSLNNAQGLLTAFAGAFFAYVLVKIGELFTRFSLREKANLDALANVEYILNDHLNRIVINIRLIDALKYSVIHQSTSVNFAQFKPIPFDKAKLQDLKNIDYINELFNYFVDIEMINDGLSVIQKYAQNLVNSVTRGDLSITQQMSIQAAYAANATELIGMMDDSKRLLEEAEKDTEILIAKNQYVAETRNEWLYLAVPWFNVTRYNREELDKELPKILKRVRKGRSEVAQSGIKKHAKTLRRNKTNNRKSEK